MYVNTTWILLQLVLNVLFIMSLWVLFWALNKHNDMFETMTQIIGLRDLEMKVFGTLIDQIKKTMETIVDKFKNQQDEGEEWKKGTDEE